MYAPTRRSLLTAAGTLAGLRSLAAATAQKPAFLATGRETYIQNSEGKRIWEYPHGTRDGWALRNGNILLAVNQRENYGGGVVEVTRSGETVFRYDGAQTEVNTVQPLPNGRILLTEAGDRPRLLEIERSGKIAVEVAIETQTENHHLQTRMSRKLPNGNYLVPQMGEKEVREYSPAGRVVWKFSTPDWPFTAIRLANGNTLTTCTVANQVIEVDGEGKTVWRLSNGDLPEPIIQDACGAQRLPNGNTVITSYRGGANGVKLFEITRDKKVLWSYRDPHPWGIHHFQYLEASGAPRAETPLK